MARGATARRAVAPLLPRNVPGLPGVYTIGMRNWSVFLFALALMAGASLGGAVEREPQEPCRRVLLPGLIRARFVEDAAPDQVSALLRGLGLTVARRHDDHWVVRAPNPADVPTLLRALNSSPLVDWAVAEHALVCPRQPLTPVRPQEP